MFTVLNAGSEAQAQRVPQQARPPPLPTCATRFASVEVKRKRKVKLKKRVQLEEDPPEQDTEARCNTTRPIVRRVTHYAAAGPIPAK